MNRLKELRKQRGLTQEYVAEKAEVAAITYQKWERYETDLGKANTDTVIKIADIYDVSIKYLLGYSDKR